MRSLALVLVAASVSACSPGIAGSWIGDMDCGGLLYDIELDIDKDTAKTFSGDGTQFRDYTNAAGQTVQEAFVFTLDMDMEKAGGRQFVNTDIVCSNWDLVVNGNDRDQACPADRFTDWTVEWDGADRLDVSTPLGCEATINR
jgi:hypothetical protein